MEGFLRYESYKDSGVEWIGRIPSSWMVRRNKYLFAERDERKGNDALTHFSLSKTVGLIRHIDSTDKEARADSLDNYKRFEPNDLVMNKMQAWNGIFGYGDAEGVVSPDYTVLRKIVDINVKFYYYLYKTKIYIQQFAIESRGMGDAFRRLHTPRFGAIYGLYPPKNIQDRIASFLDQKTAEIDEAINKKQRLIELLQEQKAILINQAVTKGLNPNVPIQDSGTDWIGKIPEHWEVVRLKRAWNILDCKHLTAPFSEKGYPLASIKEVSGKKINLATASRTNRKFYKKLIEGGRKPLVGDVIYSRNVSVGAAALVDSTEEFALGQDVCLLRSIENHGPYFVHLLHSNAITDQISHLLVGSTFNRINISQIKELFVCIPPREEQEHIDAYANRIESEFEATIEKAKKEQKVLKEFSRVLISQAVTGKIKV